MPIIRNNQRGHISMPLNKLDKEIIKRIVAQKTGVSKGSMSGAIREIIRQWESIYTEVHELRDQNQALTRELEVLAKMISLYQAVEEVSRELVSGNEDLDAAKKKMKAVLDGDDPDPGID